MSDSVRPHRRQPTRVLCPWNPPCKNTGVGCHFLLPQGSLLICLFGKFKSFGLFEASDTLGLFLTILFFPASHYTFLPWFSFSWTALFKFIFSLLPQKGISQSFAICPPFLVSTCITCLIGTPSISKVTRIEFFNLYIFF